MFYYPAQLDDCSNSQLTLSFPAMMETPSSPNWALIYIYRLKGSVAPVLSLNKSGMVGKGKNTRREDH
jgi:hypothetical protein